MRCGRARKMTSPSSAPCPQARWLIVTFQGDRVGRLYVARTANDLRIMDVSLVPSHRSRGVGTALMRGLLEEADRDGVVASLHVEPFNPALRLYERLGFAHVETRGIYHFKKRRKTEEGDLVLRADGVARDRHDEDVDPAVRGMK